MEEKTVVAGPHGPVPMEANSRRYIDQEPVTIKVTTYYARRLMSGELVEYVALAEQPMTMVAEPAPTWTALAADTQSMPAPAEESKTEMPFPFKRTDFVKGEE